MPIVYTVVSETDNGTNVSIHTTLAEANETMTQAMVSNDEWQQYDLPERPDDPEKAQQMLMEIPGYQDYHQLDDHGLDIFPISKIWTLAVDDSDGTNSYFFFSEQDLEEYIWDNLVKPYEKTLDEVKKEFDNDYVAAMSEGDHLSELMTYDINICEFPSIPKPNEIGAAISTLIEQINQMKGMFTDDDGQIAEAIETGEEAIQSLSLGDAS